MLDKQMEMMLQVANTLTAEDLTMLRASAPIGVGVMMEDQTEEDIPETGTADDTETQESTDISAEDCVQPHHSAVPRVRRRRRHSSSTSISQGEYERQRTRESKVSTVCIGHEREKHDWWPIGTTLEGHIGSEVFTAVVVENPQVKSGRSIQITSGPLAGKVCNTPTRAAIDATEHYRQANNLGRGGGVTNGWDFWKPKA